MATSLPIDDPHRRGVRHVRRPSYGRVRSAFRRPFSACHDRLL